MPPARRSGLRASALLSAGALSLHELRYLLSWGGGADRVLSEQGHAYLAYVMPLAAGLLAAGLGQVLCQLGRARPASATAPASARPRATWLIASVALLAIYTTQETVEGLLEVGHPTGLTGVFGHGGLIAIPLALAIGGLIALAERQARCALSAPSKFGVAVPRAAWPPPYRRLHPTRLQDGNSVGELALHLCGRAPPPGLR